MNGSKKYGAFIQRNTTQSKEIRSSYPFVTAWMGLESIMLSEISQVVENKYHMISPVSGT